MAETQYFANYTVFVSLALIVLAPGLISGGCASATNRSCNLRRVQLVIVDTRDRLFVLTLNKVVDL